MTLSSFLKDKLRLEKNDFLEILGIWAAGFAGLEVLSIILNLLLREDGDLYVPIGSLLLLIFGGFFLVLLVGTRFALTYQLGVQMSITRKRMMAAEWVISILETVFALGLIYLATWIDRLALAPLFGGIDLMAAIPWAVWPLVGVGALLLGFVTGALLCRYGQKGFWFLWGLFVGGALLINLFGDPMFAFIAAHGIPFGIGGALFAVGVFVFVFVQMLRIPIR